MLEPLWAYHFIKPPVSEFQRDLNEYQQLTARPFNFNQYFGHCFADYFFEPFPGRGFHLSSLMTQTIFERTQEGTVRSINTRSRILV